MTTTKTSTLSDQMPREYFEKLAEVFLHVDPRETMPSNSNERIVLDIAMETVGGIENSILDGDWVDTEVPDYNELVAIAMKDVFSEAPLEVRFIGRKKALALCQIAASTFNA